MRQFYIFFKISNAQQCWFARFVRSVTIKLFFVLICSTGRTGRTISGSLLLQNTRIFRQTCVLLWKYWRKYGSVLYLFSCKKTKMSYITWEGRNVLSYMKNTESLIRDMEDSNFCPMSAQFLPNVPSFCPILFAIKSRIVFPICFCMI